MPFALPEFTQLSRLSLTGGLAVAALILLPTILGTLLLVEIVRRQGATVDGQTILDHMRPKVASWWMPDAVEFLDEFPMTGTGKVQKMALRSRFKDYRVDA